MPEFISHRPAETEAHGEAWGRLAQPGWVIALSGDLGAGKTQWVRGFARGLGCPGRVHSPTFTLVNEYPGGRLDLHHLDLYRLETPEQVLSAGVLEFLSPAGVAVFEWAERLPAAARAGVVWRRLQIEVTGERTRTLVYDDDPCT